MAKTKTPSPKSKSTAPKAEKKPTETKKKAAPKKTTAKKAEPADKPVEKKVAAEKHKNQEVEVFVHRLPFCKVQLEVHAAPVLMDKARREAVKAINKEVSISGFRKGKAPEALILKKYGQAVEDKFQKTLADLSFHAAQKLARVPILNQNTKISFNMKDQSDKKAELVFSFETEPTVPKIDPKEFKEKKVERPKVGEKEIDEAVRQMQFYYASWSTVTDRAAKKGDYVILDLESLEEDPPMMVFQDTRFEVSDEQMADWMKKLVTGMKTGESKEGVSVADKDASEKEKKQFTPKKVRVTLKKIETAELPKLDDEFAKKAGSTTMEEMRKAIEAMLNKQADDKVRREKEEQVNQFLIEKYNFELPQSLIDSEKNYRQKQLLEDPRAKEAYLSLKPEERRKKEEEIIQQSIHAVQLFYLSRKFVQDANISITHNQVHHEAIATMQSYGAGHVDPQKIPKELYALSLSKVILAKTQEYIIEEASKAKK